MTIGERIKVKRIENGWTLREMAQKMGYSNHSTIARIESGTVDIPHSKVVKFAEVLGVSVGYLMDWENVQKKNDTISDVIVRMRTDEDFLSMVEMLNTLNSDQLKSMKELLHSFLK